MRHVETAPAKLNLRLRVLRKREDGFHEIETLMTRLEGVADELVFELELGAGGVALECDDAELPTCEDNLVLRAVSVFEKATGEKVSGRIELAKKIPSGAGLGGGSSDAAATLRALDVIAGTRLGDERLRDLAAEIGSDVPFFVTGETAICKGRGEIIEPLDGGLSRARVVLAKPAFGVPSAWAYQRWAESEELEDVSYGAQAAPWGEAVNDLERPVFEKYLVLAAMKGWLRDRAETEVAMMSGSGATVFATLRDGEDGEGLLADLSEEFGASTWCCVGEIG